MVPKRTVLIPNRSFMNAADGHLPRTPVSVAAAPWELEAELNRLGVVQKVTVAPSPEPKPKAEPVQNKGVWFEPGQPIPF